MTWLLVKTKILIEEKNLKWNSVLLQSNGLGSFCRTRIKNIFVYCRSFTLRGNMCWIFGGLHKLHVSSQEIHSKAFVSKLDKAICRSPRHEVCFSATVGHKMGSLTNQLRLAGRDTAKRIFFRDRPSWCFRSYNTGHYMSYGPSQWRISRAKPKHHRLCC